MPRIVFDASSVVGALLSQNSLPERALLLAGSNDTICLSAAVEAEIREVAARPKFQKYLTPSRVDLTVEILTAAAFVMEPSEAVTDCRDNKDNKYLELALTAGAEVIVSSDQDLLTLDPWRGIRIMTPAAYVARHSGVAEGQSDQC
jgi:putative PIN family toxin of toxin-antitoxin system